MRAFIHYCLFLGLLVSAPAGADCIDYEEYLHWQGSGVLAGMECDYHGVAASDTRVAALAMQFEYDMHWHFYIHAVDVSDPNNLRVGGYVETVGRSEDIAVSGEYAYAAGWSRLDVYDISDVDNPHHACVAPLPQDANGVDIAGHYAYVSHGSTDYYGGLSVVDISTPLQPVLLGTVDLTYMAHDVAVVGDLAIVLSGEMMLWVIDVSNPMIPVVLGSMDTLSGTYSVDAVGTYAYVAAGAAGMQVVDFSDPLNPQLVTTMPLPDDVLQVVTDGEHAFVVNWYSGLQIVDVSDPLNPVPESRIDYDRPAVSVGLWGDDLYYTSAYGLYSYDVSSCAYPPMLGSEEAPGSPSNLAEAGDYLFAASGFLQVYDITDPENPQFVASEDYPGTTYAMALDGDHVYVAADNSGLQIIDISDPLDPVLVGNLPGNWVRAVDAAGSLACILHGDYGDNFLTLDVSNPADPQILGSLELDGSIECVVIDGSFAYATSDGFYAIDISDPTAPHILDWLDFYSISRITVSGSYAYVPGMDLSTPFPIDVLFVVDVSDPENLQLVSMAKTPPTSGVCVTEPFAYLACSGMGVYVYDVSDPANPVVLGGAYTGDNVRSVHVRDDYVYAGGWIYQGGQDYYTLHVAPIQCLPTGLSELDWQPGPTRLTSYPNPSRGPSSIRFELLERGRVEVDIYSPAGRLVRRMMDATIDRGIHDLAWDGLDEDGRPVAAGVYLARITTLEETKTSRFVILR